MKTLSFVIIMVLLASLVVPTVQNSKAIPDLFLQDLYKQSDMVFYGQVITKQAGPGPDYYYYQIKVLTYFKNPQTTDSVTVTGHKPEGGHVTYPQFQIGDKAVFYISKIDGINTISPYSQIAGDACDAHSFLGPENSIPRVYEHGYPAINPRFTDANGNGLGQILTNREVILSYDDIVNNYPVSRVIPVEILIKNEDNGKQIFNKTQNLELQACSSAGILKWNFVFTEIGNYVASISVDNKTKMTMEFKVIFNSTNPLSPLKQFKSGISANDVKCENNLQLIIRAEDSSPACVKLDAAYILIKRGWAASESAYPGGDAQFALNTNSTIIPAHLPRSSGVRVPYYESSRVINYSGFDGVYNETFPYRGMQQDYVLKPGSTGVINFKIDAMISEQQGQDYPIPLPQSLNRTNYAVFYHEITSLTDLSKYPGVTLDDGSYGNFRACFTRPASEGTCIGGQFAGTNPIEAFVTDHPRVDVLFEPPSEVLPLGMNATSQVVTMMITADSNAPRGTYLVQLPFIGLDSFLLTVGNQPYHE